MKKSILMLLLVVVLAVGVLVFNATATEETHADHCVCGGHLTDAAKAASGHVCETATDWIPWGATDTEKSSLPQESGNFYLIGDLTFTGAKTILADTNVNICLHGHKITMKNSGRINVKGNLSVTDCKTTGQMINNSKDSSSTNRYKCMFYIYNGCTVNLYHGTYDARGATVADGAIAHIGNDKAAYLNIYDGTYYGAKLTIGASGLTQTRGGAFNITAASVLNMYGGQIIGGEALEHTDAMDAAKPNMGGCVSIYSGTLNMYGGSITEGKANSVYLRSDTTCHLNLHGNATIDDLYVDGVKKFTVSEDFAGSVGLTVENKDHEVVTLKNARQAACITSNEEGFSTKTTGSLGILVNDDPAHVNHCVCGGHAQGKGEHTCEAVAWQAWGYLEAEKTSLPTKSGNYYLVANVSLAGLVEVAATEDISVCLNGYDITGTGTSRIWSVKKHLAVTDCSANPGTVSAKYMGQYGGIFFVYQNATVDLYAGNWDASEGNAAQGGIAIIGNSAAGTMNIYGGTFYGANLNREFLDKNNKTVEARGGVFYMIAGSKLNIYGGTIHGGDAIYGGVIYATAGTISMHGGTLTGGVASKGGSVYLGGGTFKLYDGEITGGQAQYGGNFYIPGGKVLSAQGGRITAGIAHHDTEVAQGGNIYSEAEITLENCVISGGKATSGTTDAEGKFVAGGTTSGGNIMSLAKLTMSGCTISDGEATHGGNMRVEKVTNLTNCTISGGKATLKCDGTTNGNGGNIYSTGAATTTLTGCTITGGEAQRGGSVGAWGKVTIADTTITGGHANVNGGNLMTYSNGYVILKGNTVISNGTAANGGNVSFSSDATKTNTIGDGVQILSGTAEKLGDCIYQAGGKLKLEGAPVIAGIYALNSDSDYSMDVSALKVTTPIPVEVEKVGNFADSTCDNSAMFALGAASQTLCYDSQTNKLIYTYREIENIYVDATNGNDDNTGAQDAPVKTFAQAMNLVKNNGTIHLLGAVEVGAWEAHNKTFVITGGELVMPQTRVTLNDNVTFRNMTMTMKMCETGTSENYGSYFFYCNGFTTVIEEDVKVQYSFLGEITTDSYRSLTYLKNGVETATTASSTIYGGGNVDGITHTDLTILAGVWGNVYGGSNAKDIDGDVHLTVGGKINEGVDYISHTHSGWHIVVGGSRNGDISGTVYTNVIGGKNYTSLHGGSNGTCSIGAVELRLTAGEGMAIYGGGRGNTNTIGTVNFYYEGGTFEQVFGGNLSSCLVGEVNIHVTGGKITRRLYGGCYSNCDESSGNWTADNFVTGNVNLYIGSGAEITCDLIKDKVLFVPVYYSDRGIYGHSRRANPNSDDAENARIIFMDLAAYNKHKGNLKAQDAVMQYIMSGVTAADYVCYMGTTVKGNVISVGAIEMEDYANNALDLPAATATITVAEGSYTYEGAALTPATVTYSDNWTYGELAITYANNDKAGTATASITYEGITATTSFTIVEACKHTDTTTAYAQVNGTETHTVTVTCQCGEQISQTTEACADENKDYICDLCEGTLAKPVAQVGETQYMTLADAVANANGQTVVLLADCSDVTVAADVTIDLAGFNATGITVAEGTKLYLIDSATNDYEGAYGTAAVTGNVETFVTVDGKTYLVVADESGLYSAHCYAVAVTHISLDADKDALGYKAQFFGDEVAKSHVKAMGFNLWVTEDKVMTYQKDGKAALTLRLKNILASNGGDMTICGNAFVIFDVDTKTETSETCQTSMKEVLELVNGNFDSYNLSQQTAVKALIENFAEKLTGWALDKIQAWKAPEA